MPRQISLRRVALAVMLAVSSAHADVDPKAAQSHFAAGRLLLDQRKFADAVPELRSAYELDPKPEYLYRLAVALELSGDAKNAIEQYHKLLADNPKGRLAELAQHYVSALEAQRAAADADAAADAEAQRAANQDTERVANMRARLEATKTHVTALAAELTSLTAARAEALVAAERSHQTVTAAEGDVTRWRRSALASPSGRGRWYRLGGSLLLAGGAALIGAGAWYTNDASDTSDQLTKSLTMNFAWTPEDSALVTRGQDSANNGLTLTPLGSVGLLSGIMLLGIGESEVSSLRRPNEYEAEIGGAR